MNRKCSVFLLLLLVAAVGPGASGAPFPKKSFLIRHETFLSFGPEGPDLKIETLIFRDGLVLERVDVLDSGFSYRRFRGSAELLGALRRSLVDNQIGEQAGDCFLAAGPEQVEIYRDTVTWFGTAGQQHSFVVGTEFVASGNCPDETRALVAAVGAYEIRALVADREAEKVDYPPLPQSTAPANGARQNLSDRIDRWLRSVRLGDGR